MQNHFAHKGSPDDENMNVDEGAIPDDDDEMDDVVQDGDQEDGDLLGHFDDA